MESIRTRCFALCVATVFSLPAVAADAALSPADAAIVRALDSEYVSAWKANDRTAVLDLFTANAVILPQNHQAIGGLRNVAAFWWPAGARTTITSFDHTLLEIGGSGEFAFTRGTYRFTFDYEANGHTQKLANRGNYLMLMRRTNGVWKITHRMWADLPRK
ncbi:MAG TPA: nuclear transport factor 2 family protein [Thermoanaerobaculia bacterium]|nr:nuclear transport factor 2 family protein [Thermoanaerobaculia bacterium]